jgi:hypothetical protein
MKSGGELSARMMAEDSATTVSCGVFVPGPVDGPAPEGHTVLLQGFYCFYEEAYQAAVTRKQNTQGQSSKVDQSIMNEAGVVKSESERNFIHQLLAVPSATTNCHIRTAVLLVMNLQVLLHGADAALLIERTRGACVGTLEALLWTVGTFRDQLRVVNANDIAFTSRCLWARKQLEPDMQILLDESLEAFLTVEGRDIACLLPPAELRMRSRKIPSA